MENEKRFFAAIFLCLLVLIFYQTFVSPPPPRQPVKEALKDNQTTIPTAEPQRQDFRTVPRQPDKEETVYKPDKEVTVSTDLFTAVLSSCGAGIKSLQLHNYMEFIESPALIRFIKKMFSSSMPEQIPEEEKYKELIHYLHPNNIPFTTLFLRSDDYVAGRGDWKYAGRDNTAAEKAFCFTSVNEGIAISKDYLFKQDAYKFDVMVRVSNTSDMLQQGNLLVDWASVLPENQGGGGFFRMGMSEGLYFSYFIKGNVEKKDMSKIDETVVLEGDIEWTATEERYFSSVVMPQNEKPVQVRLKKYDAKTVICQLIFPYISLQPKEEKLYSFSLFLGPKDIDVLRAQGAGLEKMIDFGWFDILAKPLLLTLKFFYGFLGNYGLAIILLTIIIKLLFWPLTHKSFKSMKDMQKLQPEIAKLKEKYKDNREEFGRKQLELYKKYKVNPLGGCLPILLQIPVFIALYRTLMDSIELRHASFVSFWINDLSAKDPTYVAPVIMGLSMFLQQKMTPTTLDPAQAKVMMLMPVIFTVMFLGFPSGLVIYWLVNNIISIAQQTYINSKQHDAGGREECAQPKSKPKQSKKR